MPKGIVSKTQRRDTMELEVIRKKISTFKRKSGRVKITDDQLYMEILSAWENWPGTTADFYRGIEVSKTAMAGIIGKAKRMRREGHFPAPDMFTEVKVAEDTESSPKAPLSGVIVINWNKTSEISFNSVDHLVDFLNKVKAAA